MSELCWTPLARTQGARASSATLGFLGTGPIAKPRNNEDAKLECVLLYILFAISRIRFFAILPVVGLHCGRDPMTTSFGIPP